MRITLTMEEELASKIIDAAGKVGITKQKWITAACHRALEPEEKPEEPSAGIPEDYEKLNISIKEKEHEIISLKKEIDHQIELKDTYSRFLEEKVQRIDDLKEEIARIESMSMTMTEQILIDRDKRIKDLSNMIEHLQAQAAAHSVALQSAIKPALEGKTQNSQAENSPKRNRWMFWK